LWNRPQARATIRDVGKGRIHVSLDETLLLALRERADREHCNQSEVVAAALHRELSPELFDHRWQHRLSTEAHVAAQATRAEAIHREEPATAGQLPGA
jgi:metal-responsive CopG/Arc/MetJ family transcriptional regulator